MPVSENKRSKIGRINSRKMIESAVEMLENRQFLSASIKVVDLLVGYTQPAIDKEGSEAKLLNRIRRAVANVNQTLSNTGINETVRLVGAVKVTGFSETTSASGDLDKLASATASTTGLGALIAKREELGADLVELITGAQIGGTARQPTSSTATASQGFGVAAFASPISPMHEIGHMLGAGHPLSNSQQLPGSSDLAHDFDTKIDGVGVGTLMSGWYIPFFSNPDITYRGTVLGNNTEFTDSTTGLKGKANNASVMNDLSTAISGYLPTKTTDASGPIAGLGPVLAPKGLNKLNIKVVYYDDGGVNLASLSGTTLNVTGPNGFSGTATFTGISEKLVGDSSVVSPVTSITNNRSSVIANYTVNLSGVAGNLADYTFSLGSSKATDQSSNSTSHFYASASSDPSGTLAVLLPQFSSVSNSFGAIGQYNASAVDLGDAYGANIRITDFYGPWDTSTASASRFNLYQFSISDKTSTTSVTAKLSGLTGLTTTLLKLDASATFPEVTGSSGVYSNLAAGRYLIVVESDGTSSATPKGTFTLTLTSPGTAAVATPGNLHFSSSTASVARNGGTINLTVDRSGGSTGAVTVQYATSNGTALAGTDYTTTQGTLNFAAGQTTATISVPIANLTTTTAKNFKVTLSNPTGGASLGTTTVNTVTINGAPAPVTTVSTPGTLAFTASTVTADPASGKVTLTINRTGGTSGAVTVLASTSGETATSGTDYNGFSSSPVAFAAGAGSATLDITLLKSGATTSRTFKVRIDTPSGGAVLGTITTVTVTIPVLAATTTTTTTTTKTTTIPSSKLITNPDGSMDLYTFTDLGGGNVNYSLAIYSSSGTLIGTGSGKNVPYASLGFTTGEVRGGKVIFDTNSNGKQDNGELSVETDAAGDGFVLLPKNYKGGGQLVATGGTDMATGLPIQFNYLAPRGFAIVSPLTTVIQNLITRHNLHVSKAIEKVEEFLHLPLSLDLANFNALREGVNHYNAATGEFVGGDSNGLAVYRADVEIQSLVSMISGFAHGALGGSVKSIGADVFARLADVIASKTFDLDADLKDSGKVAQLLNKLVPTATSTATAEVVDAASRVIARFYRVFNDEPTPNALDIDSSGDPIFFAHFAQDQRVAENHIEPALRSLGNGSTTPSAILAKYNRFAIQALDRSEPAGDMVAPEVVVDDVRVVKHAGETNAIFNVTLSGEVSSILPVEVQYRTLDGSAKNASGDYTPVVGKLTWKAGDPATKTVKVKISSSLNVGSGKNFNLVLLNAVNAVAVDPLGVATIVKLS